MPDIIGETTCRSSTFQGGGIKALTCARPRKGSRPMCFPAGKRNRDEEIERRPVPSLRATKNTRTNGLADAVDDDILLFGVLYGRSLEWCSRVMFRAMQTTEEKTATRGLLQKMEVRNRWMRVAVVWDRLRFDMRRSLSDVRRRGLEVRRISTRVLKACWIFVVKYI